MKRSAKTQYASLALLELAASYGTGQPLQVGTIASRQRIPARFLVQILIQLKSANLVMSTRGATGGYSLAKSPTEITVWDIVTIFEQEAEIPSPLEADTSSAAGQLLQETWREGARRQQEYLASISLADIVQRIQMRTGPMYYI